MQFTRLRLTGFKSFVDPVDLEIQPGMTGIVGPNGCGKSNLVEALRWVMGETSARRMRGDDMDDVIFGGTSTRPARNVAEVALFARQKGISLPGVTRLDDVDEFEILRRIERGQGSDYRLAGKSVRARDVQTLFADAASGAHSPALVSQGRISALINAKPTERRQVLEDAAGISGLHARRHEAELKLRAAEANLERLQDVLGTMQTQLGGLKKQARQAIRYRELSEQIRRTEAMLLALRWQALIVREAELRAAFATADGKVRQAMLDVAEASTRNTDCAAALPPLRKDEAGKAEALLAAIARRDTLAAEERQLAAAIAEAERQASQLATDRAHEERQRHEAVDVETRLVAENEHLTEEAESFPAARASAEQAVGQARDAVAADDGELARLTESVAAAEAHAAALVRQRRDLDQRLAVLDRRIADERRRLESLPQESVDTAAIDTAAAALQAAELAADMARDKHAAAEKARGEAEAAIGVARAVERQASGEATRFGAEAKALRAILDSAGGEGFSPVLDQVRAARGYETALAAALAEGLEAALDPAAPAYWKPSEHGGAPAPLPTGVEALAPKITAPSALAWALAHVGLVKDFDDGDRLAASLTPGQILVSREGGVWRWDGFTRRPGAASPAAVRLEQRNRLEQVERELADANLAAEKSSVQLRVAEEAMTASAASERQARAEIMSASGAFERARGEHAQRKRDAEARAVARKALTDSVGVAESDKTAVAASLSSVDEQMAALPDATAARAELETLRARLMAARERLANCLADLGRLEREAAVRTQRLAAIDRERQEWRDRADRATRRLADLDRRGGELQETRERLAHEPARLAEARQHIMSELDVAERERGQSADRVAAAESAQQAAERALKTVEAALAEARETRIRAEGAVASTLDEFEQLRLRAVERLGEAAPAVIDLATLSGLADIPVEELPEIEAAEARFAKLNRDREAIGPVNLRAEMEVNELDQEIQRMTAEHDELIEAIGRLRQAVHSLNKEARERLLASFEAIDAHFRRLFELLFGGGRAELRLTEAEDPLDAGLEILASPPGKKLQQLSLFSGGEQALTAIALIFAMFLTNPSPICVLDEVDAPLDDANVDRFCSLVAEIAETVGTRFLIITHHRLTMARMDRLYGVTMAERGVSQLVSVDLRRADELRAAE